MCRCGVCGVCVCVAVVCVYVCVLLQAHKSQLEEYQRLRSMLASIEEPDLVASQDGVELKARESVLSLSLSLPLTVSLTVTLAHSSHSLSLTVSLTFTPSLTCTLRLLRGTDVESDLLLSVVAYGLGAWRCSKRSWALPKILWTVLKTQNPKLEGGVN